MPIVCYVDQIVIPVNRASALHMPDSFQGCFAEQGTSEGDVLPVAAIDVVCKAVKRGVIHKHPVYPI